MTFVTGLDISLTATGVAATTSSGDVLLTTISPDKKLLDMQRMDWLINKINIQCANRDLVAIEGLAFSRNLPSATERAGLHWMLRHWLWERSIPTVIVSPTALKKFVTGKGSAEKSLMLREVFRRWNITANNDNEADAYGLYRISLCLLGEETQTQAQRDVIATLRKSGQKMPELAEVKW